MKKQTKLTEKEARIPDTRQVQWEEAIPQYLSEVEKLNKESARSHRFAMLVQQLLSVEPNFIESYSVGIEQSLKVRQKDRILKGRTDNLFGNVIIEFEANIPKKRSEAEEQLRRYVAILWSQEPSDVRTPLGKECSTKVEQWLASGGTGKIKSIGKLRGMVREMLKDELREIDELVKEIVE